MNNAIVLAAGQGLRMGATQPKQFLHLSGLPILSHTLQVFDDFPDIDKLIIVIPEQETDFCRKHILEPMALKTDVTLVAGGKRRQDSVSKGLASISGDEGIVLVHDGVRPLVPVGIIAGCIQGAQKWGSCIPAILIVDTLKQTNSKNVIVRTLERDRLRLVQTPQAFQLPIIRRAYREANIRGWEATDDASLVERMGLEVHMIPGSQENLKITTPEDLSLAEFYLSRRKR